MKRIRKTLAIMVAVMLMVPQLSVMAEEVPDSEGGSMQDSSISVRDSSVQDNSVPGSNNGENNIENSNTEENSIGDNGTEEREAESDNTPDDSVKSNNVQDSNIESSATQGNNIENDIVEGMELEENADFLALREDDIASGRDGNITWTIDAGGKLTVDGMGDFTASLDTNPNYWGDYRDQIITAEVNLSGMTIADHLFYGCENLVSMDLSNFDTSNVASMAQMFEGCSSIESLDLSNFDTRNVTCMNGMFGCNNLENLDLSSFDTSNVTLMNGMFNNCSSLRNLNLSNFDTTNVTDMMWMFSGCHSLESVNLSSFNTGNVTSMQGMFNYCDSLNNLDLSNFDTNNVTDMLGMFNGCSSLKSLDLSNFDTGNVAEMILMFSGCSSLNNLNLSSFDTSNVTSMREMFSGCKSLKTLDISNFNTGNVTDMCEMFAECNNLENLNLSNFNTSNVTSMYAMFLGCSHLENLDLSNFDTVSVVDAESMFDGCNNLTTIQTPLNLQQSVILPTVAGTVWRLSDGTEITELPKNRSDSVLIIKHSMPALYFQVTGAVGHARYDDIYIAENTEQEVLDTLFDPFYENTWQTIFVNDADTELSDMVPVFDSGKNTEIQVTGYGTQRSGESIQDFSKGTVPYTAISSGERKEYQVTFVKRETGSRIFVNGPEEREIFLTDYFNNQHDILIANTGDTPLTGIRAELLDAVNIKLDDSWTISSTLEAFSQVPNESQTSEAIMTNFGKVRLVPDGEGEISGTLKITADGQEPVYIKLTGYSSNPKIITTTTDLNMDDVIRVKYVPYSYTVETNNEFEENKVTFSVESGKLAEGLQMYPATGEIYGVPLEVGEFEITVKAVYSWPEFLPSYAQLTLIVKDNTEENINVATDNGYDLIQKVGNIDLDFVSGDGSQTMVSLGEYAEFRDVFLDGEKLTKGEDYTSEAGSTRITILNQTLTRGNTGTHTLGIEFRTQDTDILKRAAQNYTITGARKPDEPEVNEPGSETTEKPDTTERDEGRTDNTEDSEIKTTTEIITYTVMRGDTLWKIAAKFYGNGALWPRIYEDNAAVIKNPGRIYAGQKLQIHLVSETPAAEVAEGKTNGRFYRILPMDTLWKISRKVYGNGWMWEKIYQANRNVIQDYRYIHAGQVLYIPDK